MSLIVKVRLEVGNLNQDPCLEEIASELISLLFILIHASCCSHPLAAIRQHYCVIGVDEEGKKGSFIL